MKIILMSQSKKMPRPNQTITMQDVARLAGVSQSTVSRVLSKSPSSIPISDETLRRVQDAVTELGYMPNLTARALRKQASEMIAIMIADISNPFYHSLVRAVQDVAHQHRYDVIIANTDHLLENERHFCQAMIRRPVDGILMVPYHLDEAALDNLIERTGVHVVVLGSHIQHPQIDYAFANDELAVTEATRWMVGHKRHQRIGYVTVPGTQPGERRLKGFLAGLAACGIAEDPALITCGNWTHESGARAVDYFMNMTQPPTAIMFCNDIMAVGGLNAARDRGLQVPDDLAIVGFDNIPLTTLVRPRLTTIGQYPADLGHLLATALFDRIEKRYDGAARVYRVGLSLIERDST